MTEELSAAAESLGSPDAPHFRRFSRINVAMLISGLVLIPIWQTSFARHTDGIENTYRQAGTGRMGQDFWREFFYFHYYLGLFPVISEESAQEYSVEGAKALLRDHPDSILMEKRHKIRDGDLGQLFVFWVDALLRGTAEGATVRPFNVLVFCASLMALWAALWWAGYPGLGILLTVLVGSNPHQLYEVYVNEHVLGFAISFAFLMLALHVPLMGARAAPRWYPWFLPVFAGLCVAVARQIRPEPYQILVAIPVIYLTAPGLTWRMRGAMAGLFLTTVSMGTSGFTAYFDREFREATIRVEEIGGHVYNGPRRNYHLVWFPIFAGLGDFGSDKGYQWNDRNVYQYGLPILEARLGIDLDWQGGLYLNHYYDDAKKYGKKLEDYPEFMEIVREKVVRDISGDPAWYAGILWKRLNVIATQTTPARLAWGGHWTTIVFWPIAAIPLALALALSREWFLLKLLLFTLPLSLVTLFVISSKGTSYYACYHLFVFPVFLAYLATIIARRRRETRSGLTVPWTPRLRASNSESRG